MAIALPRTWWDQLLDGQVYVVKIRDTGYTNLANFRAACYREGDSRECLVATHKSGIGAVIVQAWGNPDRNMEMFTPKLKEAAMHALPAPTVPAPLRPRPAVQCTCGRGPLRHMPNCALFMYGRPAPRVELTDDELLGPCTCGQAPRCLPSCARAGGESEPEVDDAVMEPATDSGP